MNDPLPVHLAHIQIEWVGSPYKGKLWGSEMQLHFSSSLRTARKRRTIRGRGRHGEHAMLSVPYRHHGGTPATRRIAVSKRVPGANIAL